MRYQLVDKRVAASTYNRLADLGRNVKLLYLNPSFTIYPLRNSEFNVCPPPYDEIVAEIAPDFIFKETRGDQGVASICEPMGIDLECYLGGRTLEPIGRQLTPDDNIVFFSLAHLFRSTFDAPIRRIEQLIRWGPKVTFWDENLNLDFKYLPKEAHAKLSMFTAMNKFVSFRENFHRLREEAEAEYRRNKEAKSASEA